LNVGISTVKHARVNLRRAKGLSAHSMSGVNYLSSQLGLITE